MPTNPMEAPATAPAVPAQRDPHFTALVVDDHPLIRESVAVRLHSLGADEVVEAASCAEARARACSMPPDLAVVELRLPDGSGLDLLAELRGAGCTRLIVLAARPRSLLGAGRLRRRCPGVSAQERGLGYRHDGLRRVLDGGVYADPSQQIGDQLCLSALTVKSHLARLGRRLGTGDRAAIVAVAMRAGIVR